MPKPEDSIVTRVIRYMSVIAGMILLTTTVAITLSAISRYVFHRPIAIVAQGTYYLIPSIIALSLGYTLIKGGHVGATILVDYLPRKIQRMAEFISSCLVLALSAFFCWGGILRVWMAWKGNEYLPRYPEVPLLPFTILPLVGLLFLLLAAVGGICKSLRDLLNPNEYRTREILKTASNKR